jgi:hypothetical protein
MLLVSYLSEQGGGCKRTCVPRTAAPIVILRVSVRILSLSPISESHVARALHIARECACPD